MHQGKFDAITIVSSDDHSASQYKAVTAAGVIAVAGTTAIGLAQNKPAAAGRHLTVGYAGHMKGFASAAVANGAQLTVTTSGWLVTATSGTAVVGKALAAANSGDVFPGIFNFANGMIIA